MPVLLSKIICAQHGKVEQFSPKNDFQKISLSFVK
jgi:hypothetical protein